MVQFDRSGQSWRSTQPGVRSTEQAAEKLFRDPRDDLGQGDLESERTQEGGEGTVEFVAEPAAALVDDLVQEAGFVADDFAAEMDVEVLEGDGEEVGAVEGLQSLRRWLGRACMADAFEIGGNVHYSMASLLSRL